MAAHLLPSELGRSMLSLHAAPVRAWKRPCAEGPRRDDGAPLVGSARSAALARVARLAPAPAAGAAAAGAEQREAFDVGGLLGVAVQGRVGRGGRIGHGVLLGEASTRD